MNRFKNPQVLISLAMLFSMLLIQFGIEINTEWVNDTMYIICSILVILGIVNNPETPGFDNPFKK